MQASRSCLRIATLGAGSTVRSYSHKPVLDVEQLLATPTWSVSSLLPTNSSSSAQVTSKQLHHLLRLSALPLPKDEAEERKMLSTLSSQLHFARDVQNVDATGVEPLRSLRDETVQGQKEAELGLEALRPALEKEEIRGKHHQRVRRRREAVSEAKWDVLGSASKKVGKYFVVEGGREA